ncbi:glycosyltransferase family 4 protein [Carnobacterium antarcticum]|uniref:Glycosyltransferase family 4 protein n=1 Tax=Carnobacterium antarcticum TaxID=2126436 RepID=A0ABW4NIL8_9LACT|nr:glycosyltransferase family 4 protein [Carnobacterium sp. CP1]ALV21543.1 glycosyltransferase [Carnobacterium sp. CP1]
MKKHILVISQYFFPEQFRINDMCEDWISRGYKVTVVTGIPNYPSGKFFNGYGLFTKNRENYKGIEIVRLPIVPRGNNSIMLVLNYFSFVISGFFWQLFTKVEADQVFIFEVSPMTQALPGVWYAKKHRLPCFLYVQDLWPENVEIITGIKNQTIISSIGKMVDYIYKNCTKIFTTSQSFKKSINERQVPIEKIEYWPQYAEEFYQPLKAKETTKNSKKERFNIIFAGNIGHAQGLDILPKTAKILKQEVSENKIHFNIIGSGRYKETLIKTVDNYGVRDMFNFIDKQPAEKIPEFMADNDAAFICLTSSPLFKMTIPAKLQSYMACGIAIIASAGGETSEIIEEAHAGLTAPPGDEEKLAEIILTMANKTENEVLGLGKNAKKYSDFHFNKTILMNQMEKKFDNCEESEESYNV